MSSRTKMDHNTSQKVAMKEIRMATTNHNLTSSKSKSLI